MVQKGRRQSEVTSPTILLTDGPSMQEGWSPAMRRMQRIVMVSNLTFFLFPFGEGASFFTTIATSRSFLTLLFPSEEADRSEGILEGRGVTRMREIVAGNDSRSNSNSSLFEPLLESLQGPNAGGDSSTDTTCFLVRSIFRLSLLSASSIVDDCFLVV
jgi:hypothetical protein